MFTSNIKIEGVIIKVVTVKMIRNEERVIYHPDEKNASKIIQIMMIILENDNDTDYDTYLLLVSIKTYDSYYYEGW